MIDKIEERIRKNIDCFYLKILDESPNHAGYDGKVSHIKIIIVSNLFSEMPLLKRHKEVFNALGDYTAQIHAISIVPKSLSQWESSKEYITSPDCAK